MARISHNLPQLQKQREQIEKKIAAAQRIMQANVARVKKDIQRFGLTVQDLFGDATAVNPVASAKASKGLAAAKYAHPDGRTWSGKGPRPAWLRAAVESGASPDEFLVGANPAEKPTKRAAKSTKKAVATKAVRKKTAAKKVIAKAFAAKRPASKKVAAIETKPAPPKAKAKPTKVVKSTAPKSKPRPKPETPLAAVPTEAQT